MWPVFRNLVALFAGVFVGSVVNMTIVNVGPHIIPLPEGADVSTMEGVRDSVKLFTPANFLCPFLAHALGTLVGAFVAAKLAFSHPMKLAMGVGLFFLMGGIAVNRMIGGPTWFIAADIIVGYLPMGFLGGRLGCSPQPVSPSTDVGDAAPEL